MRILSTLFNTLALISFIILISCSNSDKSKQTISDQVSDIEDIKNEFDEVSREFVDLFNSGDTKGLANMFTEDAKSMGPNESSHLGISNIEINFNNIINSGAVKAKIKTIGLWGDEKMLAEEGVYIFSDKDGNELDKGKYITLWRKENGKWKIFRDCVNSDLPILSSN